LKKTRRVAVAAGEVPLVKSGQLGEAEKCLGTWIIRILDTMPDALLWCDMQDHANYLINAYLAEHQGRPLPDPHAKPRKDMFVYTRRDLEELLCELTELQKAALHLHYQPCARPFAP
jgi:hypothetical protein